MTGGTRRRHRRGGLGFDNMSSRAANEHVSELSKKKTREELERLQTGPTKPKVYESEGTGTRSPSPVPAAQMASTERARSNSQGGRRRRHSKRKTHRRRR